MSAVAVGADIEALCSKCGDVWHVVVAKVGTRIAKVQCKQCGGYHRYRPSDGKPVAAVERRPRKAPLRAGGTPTSGTRSVPAPTIDPSKPIRPYRMSELYQTGDQIRHLRFGVGVVESAAEPGKIAVLFDAGRKVLAAAKPGQTLATANELSRSRRSEDVE